MLCRICEVQIHPGKHVLDHAGCMAPTRQRELDHTDHTDRTDHTDQENICLPWNIYIITLWWKSIIYLSEECNAMVITFEREEVVEKK